MSETPQSDSLLQIVGSGLKLVIGSIGLGVIVGFVFWCGAMFNQVGEMQKHLSSIDSTLSKISDFQETQVEVREHEKRITRIEDQVKQLR